jgi:hypothetical protein
MFNVFAKVAGVLVGVVVTVLIYCLVGSLVTAALGLLFPETVLLLPTALGLTVQPWQVGFVLGMLSGFLVKQ